MATALAGYHRLHVGAAGHAAALPALPRPGVPAHARRQCATHARCLPPAYRGITRRSGQHTPRSMRPPSGTARQLMHGVWREVFLRQETHGAPFASRSSTNGTCSASHMKSSARPWEGLPSRNRARYFMAHGCWWAYSRKTCTASPRGIRWARAWCVRRPRVTSTAGCAMMFCSQWACSPQPDATMQVRLLLV
jgi:hypothetical protein